MFFLSAPVLTSRTAGYVTRMSGGVGGGSREATPYPYKSKAELSPQLSRGVTNESISQVSTDIMV
ncbi:hypothetical protein DSCA_40410 [Desulfosarcina alkanivorans]|uniref:Uncharacterized protein n=1 Tax=Desulfosarcina alkanivorans TaxID=571177 RepID=A0A5K7YSY3_9BACT|nr:hypothetical protein DSCA_40410 [Desulfosarcina alkanivorans]